MQVEVNSHLVSCSQQLDQHSVQDLHLATQTNLRGHLIAPSHQRFSPIWVQATASTEHIVNDMQSNTCLWNTDKPSLSAERSGYTYRKLAAVVFQHLCRVVATADICVHR